MAVQLDHAISRYNLSDDNCLYDLDNEHAVTEIQRTTDMIALLKQEDVKPPCEVALGLKTFTSFPRLPFELRAKIIKSICSMPRLIDLWAVAVGEQDALALEKIDSWPFVYHSLQARAAPAVLHVSKEFRTEGMRFYSLEFGTEFNQAMGPATIKITTPPKIYVNWDCDIIAPMPLLGQVRPGNDNSEWHPILEDFKGKYPNLNRLAVECILGTAIHETMTNHSLSELMLYELPDVLYKLWDPNAMTIDGRVKSLDLVDLSVALDSLERRYHSSQVWPISIPSKLERYLRGIRQEVFYNFAMLRDASGEAKNGDLKNGDRKDGMLKSPAEWTVPSITLMAIRMTLR